MGYKFNPFTGNLDEVGAGASAFEVLGTVATFGDLPGGATQSDVYLVEADDNFYVWDGSAWTSIGTLAGPQGPAGATGPAGADGADGADGVGVITGGTTGQVLAKASNTDYDTEWTDQTGGGGTPGGADTQVQFNDGGAFGGDPGLTYDKTTDKLTVGGDLELENGGTFTTTLQTVTPTANRTVSIPDATGTIGLVNGPTGSIQFNQAGALSGTSDFSTTLDWNNATTTFTGLKLNATDTASAADSKLLDLQTGGASKISVSKNGNAYFQNGSSSAPVIRLGTSETGLYTRSTGARINFAVAGFDTGLEIGGNTFALASTARIIFLSGALPSSAPDCGLKRDSAGVVKITNGSSGTGYLKLITTTVSALTAAATVGAGTKAFVTDSTSTLSSHHGQTVVGGGTNFVPVFSDGTNWIVG
jgi:hypothetical protein